MSDDSDADAAVSALVESYGRLLFEAAVGDRPAIREAMQHRLLDEMEKHEPPGMTSAEKFGHTVRHAATISEMAKMIDARVAELDAEFANGPAAGNA